ncbi:MAG: orotidine-5'-phosphate decarboxylase [Melioribacteraceae bacterium]
MTSQEKLKKTIEKSFHICVGLDTDIVKIPKHLSVLDEPTLEFNKIIIDSTIEYANSYKINFAFYEKDGLQGIEVLEKTIKYIKIIDEKILIIADAKRGDIGNTSKKYAESVYDYFNCDAITLHPYMGSDSIEPFLGYKDKINFILGLTSNPSAFDFEKQKLKNGRFLYQEVIEKTNEWNTNNNLGLVFGATNIDELKLNISSFNDMPILLPGVGAQGGSLEDIVSEFKMNNKNNFIINVSRGLIYIDDSKKFALSVENKIKEYNNIIMKILH